MNIKYKIIELIDKGAPTGVYTVRKETKVSRIEISSLVYTSNNKQDCELYIKSTKGAK